MKRGAWLDVRCPACSGAAGAVVAAGEGGSPHPAAVRAIAPGTFAAARAAYLDRLAAVIQLSEVSFAQEGEDRIRAVNHAREAHDRAACALYDMLLEGILPPPEEHALVAMRCDHLLKVPAATLAARRDPARFRRAGLPLDLHPRIAKDHALRVAASPGTWPCPRPADVCILLGDDLGEGAIVAREGEGDASIDPLDVAAVVRWSLARDRALAAARARGARIAPLTTDTFFQAIEGALGGFLQIVASVAEGEDGAPLLICNDAAVDLPRLAGSFGRLARAERYRSPLRAVDLVVCGSSGELSLAFHAAGVLFVTSTPVVLHTGATLEALCRLYEGDVLDGRTPFQHAWTWADLP